MTHRGVAIAVKILRYRLAWAALGMLIVCAIGVARWRELSWTSEAIRHARDGLQATIDSEATLEKAASSRVQEFRRHQFDALREAVRRIDSAPPLLPHPVPVFAFVRESSEGDVRLELSLQWVENGFGVNGFYAIDHAGQVTECPGLFTADDIRSTYPRVGSRHLFIGIVTNASDEEWWQSVASSDNPPPFLARLLPDFFSGGDVRLGLLTNLGREPITTVVRYWTREDTLAGTGGGADKAAPERE